MCPLLGWHDREADGRAALIRASLHRRLRACLLPRIAPRGRALQHEEMRPVQGDRARRCRGNRDVPPQSPGPRIPRCGRDAIPRDRAVVGSIAQHRDAPTAGHRAVQDRVVHAGQGGSTRQEYLLPRVVSCRSARWLPRANCLQVRRQRRAGDDSRRTGPGRPAARLPSRRPVATDPDAVQRAEPSRDAGRRVFHVPQHPRTAVQPRRCPTGAELRGGSGQDGERGPGHRGGKRPCDLPGVAPELAGLRALLPIHARWSVAHRHLEGIRSRDGTAARRRLRDKAYEGNRLDFPGVGASGPIHRIRPQGAGLPRVHKVHFLVHEVHDR